MHLDFVLILASAVVGFLVGLTGVGGGALMTPMLVLLFGVAPSAAITSDLVAALFMKPAGVAVHWRRNNVNGELVRYLCYGSLPGAFAGTYALSLLGQTSASEHRLQIFLGAALIVGAVSILTRALRTSHATTPSVTTRRAPTIVVGALGGFMVGLTSVGAGSLIVVLLLFLYPTMRNDHLVGTDLAQSVPLTLSATLGTLLFNHVNFSLTISIILGSVPAVIVGSLLSSRVNGYALRLVITATVLLSGLKYVGTPVGALGAAAVSLAVLVGFLVWRRRAPASIPEAVEDVVALLPTRFD
ncbi:MAG: sulfite exporter TauE/SafE family protein [Acidobacteriota bacterium]|nr:sulfite exporter TauE/SafE family protein [Acidobacteriota bacterium]